MELDKRGLREVSIAKRCPKCNGLALTFDHRLGRITCEDCGYEMSIPII